MNTQCEDENDDLFIGGYDFTTIVDKSEYGNLETANFKLSNAEIIGDCLTVTVSASACDGNTWEYNLVGINLTEQLLKVNLIVCFFYFL